MGSRIRRRAGRRLGATTDLVWSMGGATAEARLHRSGAFGFSDVRKHVCAGVGGGSAGRSAARLARLHRAAGSTVKERIRMFSISASQIASSLRRNPLMPLLVIV